MRRPQQAIVSVVAVRRAPPRSDGGNAAVGVKLHAGDVRGPRPVSVLSRCMWRLTSPGNTRSPPMSSAGALFDNAGAAPSPTIKIFPSAKPISTRRPSARRQLARNVSTVVIASSLVNHWRYADATEGAERALDHRRIQPPGDEYQTRPSVPIGPRAEMTRRMHKMLHRVYRDRRFRIGDIEDAFDPQQLVTIGGGAARSARCRTASNRPARRD
jgi:hypothetical protein